jgi:3-hydroxyphenylacetate 6-hydroxylase
VRLICAFEIMKGSEVDVDPVRGCKSTEDLVSSPRRYTLVFRPRDEKVLRQEAEKH